MKAGAEIMRRTGLAAMAVCFAMLPGCWFGTADEPIEPDVLAGIVANAHTAMAPGGDLDGADNRAIAEWVFGQVQMAYPDLVQPGLNWQSNPDVALPNTGAPGDVAVVVSSLRDYIMLVDSPIDTQWRFDPRDQALLALGIVDQDECEYYAARDASLEVYDFVVNGVLTVSPIEGPLPGDDFGPGLPEFEAFLPQCGAQSYSAVRGTLLLEYGIRNAGIPSDLYQGILEATQPVGQTLILNGLQNWTFDAISSQIRNIVYEVLGAPQNPLLSFF